MHLYVNGALDAAGEASGDWEIHKQARVLVGMDLSKNKEPEWSAWSGLVDDIAIFSRALDADEIGRLYRVGLSSFIAGPELERCVGIVQKAEAAAKEQKPRQAIDFLEKQIAEYEQWKKENPNHPVLNYKRVTSDLYFLLARATEAAGATKSEEVVNAYGQAAFEPDRFSSLSVPRQGPALLWLYANLPANRYDGIVCSIIRTGPTCLKAAASEAETMIQQQSSKAAVRFLEGNLAAYSKWRQEHPFDDVRVEDALPTVYFQLAKAREATGAVRKNVTDAYKKTFGPSQPHYISQRTASLIWLLENDCNDEYTEVISSFGQTENAKELFKAVLDNVCRYFESKENWRGFEKFLDVLFVRRQEGRPSDRLLSVESCVSNNASRWVRKYQEYLESRPGLKLERDCAAAEKHIASGEFAKAAELYQAVLNRCEQKDSKPIFEFQLCKCVFNQGKYAEAAQRLQSFIANNRTVSRKVMADAMLMKGQAELQLGRPQEALHSLFALAMEYPETDNIAQVTFFLGYCYMLQNEFKAAQEAFETVTKDYPTSAYTDKALFYIARIKSMGG
jgi:tetratricopeptide (TPR) repeat protein